MKKTMFVLLTFVGVVLLSVASSLSFNYYMSKVHPELISKDANVSVQVQEAVTQVTNPTFKSVDDVRQYRQRVYDEDAVDSIFLSMPDDAMTAISQVVIGRLSFATKKDIVEEFRRNYKPVYQYIKVIDPTLQQSPGEDTSDNSKTPPALKADTTNSTQPIKVEKNE